MAIRGIKAAEAKKMFDGGISLSNISRFGEEAEIGWPLCGSRSSEEVICFIPDSFDPLMNEN